MGKAVDRALGKRSVRRTLTNNPTLAETIKRAGIDNTDDIESVTDLLSVASSQIKLESSIRSQPIEAKKKTVDTLQLDIDKLEAEDTLNLLGSSLEKQVGKSTADKQIKDATGLEDLQTKFKETLGAVEPTQPVFSMKSTAEGPTTIKDLSRVGEKVIGEDGSRKFLKSPLERQQDIKDQQVKDALANDKTRQDNAAQIEKEATAQGAKAGEKQTRGFRSAKAVLKVSARQLARVINKSKQRLESMGLSIDPTEGIQGKFFGKLQGLMGATGYNEFLDAFAGNLNEVATELAKGAAPSAKVGPALIEIFAETLPKLDGTLLEGIQQLVTSAETGFARWAARARDKDGNFVYETDADIDKETIAFRNTFQKEIEDIFKAEGLLKKDAESKVLVISPDGIASMLPTSMVEEAIDNGFRRG